MDRLGKMVNHKRHGGGNHLFRAGLMKYLRNITKGSFSGQLWRKGGEQWGEGRKVALGVRLYDGVIYIQKKQEKEHTLRHKQGTA